MDSTTTDQSLGATDWGQTFRDIITLGATKYFNQQTVPKLYNNGPGGGDYQISPDGLIYTIGQSGNAVPVAQGQIAIPPAMLLIGLGALVYFATRG